MSFNFGGFISGLSKQIVSDIEREKAKQDQFDLLAEQEATKLRLANASERRKQRKADADNMAFLKTLGFSDAKAQWIMKGGANSIQMYANFAQTAMESGIDPDTILDSNLINQDHADPRNEANLEAVKNSAIARPTGVDTSNPFKLNLSVLKKQAEPIDPKLNSLTTGYATAVNKQYIAERDHGINSTQYKQATDEVDHFFKKIQNEPKRTEVGVIFTASDVERIMSNVEARQAQRLEFGYDLQTKMVQVVAGRRGPKAVAMLRSAEELAYIANPTQGVYDTAMMARVNYLKSEAQQDLDAHGRNVANGTIGEAMKKFNYNKTTFEDGKYIIPTFKKILEESEANPPKAGDVYIVKQKNKQTGVVEFRIKVYTGIKSERTPLGIFNRFHDAGIYAQPNQ